ncbi:type 1 glutamine amidotransferase domain-containing protein [Methylobacterium sp. GC_Met_2]|uniref:type 1 glutamine amidotransferase domain-containing protein n=1 Tax=Methylobacterium sp. GC_Met_2 TaxID=2937376 RepID=UPI00226B4DC8|nr:type 1 glutamine amidotransferase domain-containing protein [Methylobacterium sp. GC_Met_2]
MAEIKGRKIAVLATDGVEEVELTEPVQALQAAGASTTLVSLKPGEIQAMEKDVNPVGKHAVEAVVADADPAGFDGLLLPGGTTNPDALRLDEKAVAFVKAFVEAGKPIAAICHGPWMLINAEGVAGKTLTSWPSLQVDLRNAGANWVDREVAKDGKLVTSRNPKDIPAFCEAIVELFGQDA